MLRDFLNRTDRPNPFTETMGKRIRQAREERGMSQEELADAISRRRPSISEMETGKMEPDASTLIMLGGVLKKPLIYFYPPVYASRFAPDTRTPLEQELLLEFRRLENEAHQRVAIAQVRALAELSALEDELE